MTHLETMRGPDVDGEDRGLLVDVLPVETLQRLARRGERAEHVRSDGWERIVRRGRAADAELTRRGVAERTH